MLKKLLPLAIIATAVVSTGCSVRSSKEFSSPLDAGSVRAEFAADIAVGGKISGESTATTLFGFITLGDNKFAEGITYGSASSAALQSPLAGILGGMDSTGPVKNAAAYDAVTKSSADVIIAPKYVLDIQDYIIWKEVHATVSGYKGTITRINQRKLGPAK